MKKMRMGAGSKVTAMKKTSNMAFAKKMDIENEDEENKQSAREVVISCEKESIEKLIERGMEKKDIE